MPEPESLEQSLEREGFEVIKIPVDLSVDHLKSTNALTTTVRSMVEDRMRTYCNKYGSPPEIRLIPAYKIDPAYLEGSQVYFVCVKEAKEETKLI